MDEKMEAFRAGLHQLFAEFPVSGPNSEIRYSYRKSRRHLLGTLVHWESYHSCAMRDWAVRLGVPEDRLVTLDALIYG